MKSNKILKDEGWASLSGKWGTSALFTLVYLIIVGVISGLSEAGNLVGEATGSITSLAITIVLCSPLEMSYEIAFLKQFRGEEQQLGMLGIGFESRKWKTSMLKNLYTILWACLFLIPGIVKNYSYAMTSFIMNDDPEISGNAAIEKSMRMMQGKKMQLFLMDLTFLLWVILSIFTLGILLLWMEPYFTSSHAAFYEDVKAELGQENASVE